MLLWRVRGWLGLVRCRMSLVRLNADARECGRYVSVYVFSFCPDGVVQFDVSLCFGEDELGVSSVDVNRGWLGV